MVDVFDKFLDAEGMTETQKELARSFHAVRHLTPLSLVSEICELYLSRHVSNAEWLTSLDGDQLKSLGELMALALPSGVVQHPLELLAACSLRLAVRVSRVANPGHLTTDDFRRRALELWRAITKDSKAGHKRSCCGQFTFDAQGRLVDASIPNPNWVQSLFDSGNVQRVLIPVVHGEEAFALWARVTCFRLSETSTVKLPRLFLGPSSLISFVDNANNGSFEQFRRLLEQIFQENAADKFHIESDAHFMLELEPIEQDFAVFPVICIDQPSWKVGVLLAGWAARKHMELRPIMVTGAVSGTPDNISVLKITWITQKLTRFRALRKGHPALRFLFPEPNLEQPNPDEGIYKLPLLWKDIVDQANEFLTDGFDAYRDRFADIILPGDAAFQTGTAAHDRAHPEERAFVIQDVQDELLADQPKQFLAGDWRRYAQVRNEFSIEQFFKSGSPPEATLVAVPFNNDPTPVVRYLVRSVLGDLTLRLEKDKNSDGYDIAKYPIPLPLPLHRLKLAEQPISRTAWSMVSDAIQDAIREDLYEPPVLPDSLIESVVFENRFVSRDLSQFWLIAYSQPSLEVEPKSDLAAVQWLQRLCAVPNSSNGKSSIQGPGIIFVASDIHHARMILAVWEDPEGKAQRNTQ